jgi:hypothetical protein
VIKALLCSGYRKHTLCRNQKQGRGIEMAKQGVNIFLPLNQAPIIIVSV